MSARAKPTFEVLAVLTILGLLGGYTVLARGKAKHRNADSQCRNNLGQIAMAALQYADDHRFFPHFTQISRLDGDHTSDTSARAMRVLVAKGYLDDPSVFICPASLDAAPALAPAHVILTAATDNSYGWTRRGLTTNSHCNNFLAGDKARLIEEKLDRPERAGNMHGNHRECMNVVSTDAHVQRIVPEGDQITTGNIANTTNSPPGGYLGVLND